MRSIRLPEPPTVTLGMPEIFEGGIYGVIRRAVIISNALSGAENQSIGLVRALGLSNRQLLYHVTRPRGGIHNWLNWLPVSLHKKVDFVIRRLCRNSQFIGRGEKLMPLVSEKGGSGGLLSILEADSRQIATMARESFDNNLFH